MELYKVTEQQYGWIFAGVAGGLITSSQVNTLLLKKYTSEQVIVVALLCQSLAGILLFTGTLLGLLNVYSTIGLCFLFLCCQGFTFPNTSALSLAPFAKTAGSASALLGCIQMAIGAFTSAMVSYFANNTALPMTGVMGCCAVISFTIVLLGGRVMRNENATKEQAQEESAEMMITS